MEQQSDPEFVALDINMPSDTQIHSEGTAYYRITPALRDFIKLCAEKHGLLGFTFDGSLNFGIILKNPRNDNGKNN